MAKNDMYSLMYVLLYLKDGALPWSQFSFENDLNLLMKKVYRAK